ncbi:hypothetical protein EJB05_10475 [Eragrostis curvula]|uniref:Uncharacterized protein n=1 Tax=Eragrostis curvula TaxID=38414 RepID=A0A5J9VNY8_9POAL|nr:hypothetical protein EJB05_10475 [Eragrostis curvula]
MAAAKVLLLTLAVVLLVAGELPVPVTGQKSTRVPPTTVRGGESTIPGRLSGSAASVEEEKAYIVGRPLFKFHRAVPAVRARPHAAEKSFASLFLALLLSSQFVDRRQIIMRKCRFLLVNVFVLYCTR